MKRWTERRYLEPLLQAALLFRGAGASAPLFLGAQEVSCASALPLLFETNIEMKHAQNIINVINIHTTYKFIQIESNQTTTSLYLMAIIVVVASFSVP